MRQSWHGQVLEAQARMAPAGGGKEEHPRGQQRGWTGQMRGGDSRGQSSDSFWEQESLRCRYWELRA